jgi:TIR domain/PASTA domain
VADIFISYASPDRERARLLADGLEHQGWSVWWDREIQPGSAFDDAIEEALNAARCVIVLWSNASVRSDWVKAEAAEAAEKRILVPALIDKVKIPLQFRRFQAADLTTWTGAAGDAGFGKLSVSVARLLGQRAGADVAPLRIPPEHEAEAKRPFDARWLVAVAAIAIAATVAVILMWNKTAAVDVPSVVGQSLNEAKGSIAAAKLTTGKVTEEPSQASALGTVLRQEPPPGAIATKGTAVALVISTASAPTPSPPVEAKDQAKSDPAAGFLDPGILSSFGFAVAFEVKELGLHVTFVSKDSGASAILSGAKGPGGLVIRLDPGIAQKAGLHAGDVITKIGRTQIVAEGDLRTALRTLGPGVTRFMVKRSEQELALDVDCPACTVVQ